ncbi:MAG TPA: tetratricopeptide repeat protein [Steroidobacteraceae bacterium]|jgi:tetratricopeptide (TPR) repeat protein|nr:tetratricopeptide repeat protein [Steroidobacteraceae bacterium]
MKVKGNLVAAIALGAALVCGASLAGITPARAAAPAHTVSAKVGKPLKAAQDALQKQDYKGALAKLQEADGMSGKTPYEQHLIHEMEGYAYVRTKQYPQAAKALEPGLTDGFLDPGQLPQRTVALAQLNYQIKNYDKAIQFGTQAIEKGYADAQMPTLVGQAYYLKNDWKGVQRFEKMAIAAEEKKGQQPSNEALQLLLSSCLKMHDDNCTDNALQDLVVYHPKPEYWQQLLYSMFKTVKNDHNLLQTYRLASEVNVLKRPDDFTDFAQLAIEAGSPGEAEQVIQKGMQANIFPDTRTKGKAQRLLADAQHAAKRDEKTLDKSAQQAARSANGQEDVGLGLAYFGYQQYDKAVQALTQGIAKGGLKSAGEAQLLLGISQLKQGNKDAAIKSFKSVKGDPTLERLATLWSLRARQGQA